RRRQCAGRAGHRYAAGAAVVPWRRGQPEVAFVILELDLGNTRGKWRLLDDGGLPVDRGAGAVAEWLAGAVPAAWPSRLARVRVASVLREEVERELVATLAPRAGDAIAFARAADHCGSVR